MTASLQGTARRALEALDWCYHRHHGLHPVGPALYVCRTTHPGAPLILPDGTRVETDDPLGVLHLNNARLSSLSAHNAAAAGLCFARLMRISLRCLADRSRADPAFTDIQAYRGVTWIPPHGQRAGFFTTPLPAGPRRTLLCWHFRLLLWAYAGGTRGAAPEPRVYWLTRSALQHRYASPSSGAR